MNELKLTSPIPPSVNHYLAYRAIMRGGKALAVSYTTKEAKAYKKYFSSYVQEQVAEQGWDIKPNKTQHFYLDAVFFFPQIDMDANNYFKVMCDAITDARCIWEDDNVVCERVQGIYYDSSNPRIEMTIRPVDYIGVFENASQMDEFTLRCIGCARHKRNCSILRRAMEGYIQGETDGRECSSFRALKDKKKQKETKENGNE